MPATIHVNGNGATAAPPAFQEFTGPNGTGASVPVIGPLTYASDAPAVATVDANGLITAVAPGTANITVTDTGNSLSASDVLTVTAATAVSATLALVAL